MDPSDADIQLVSGHDIFEAFYPSLGAALVLTLATGPLLAHAEEPVDEQFQAVLAVNPGLSEGELKASVTELAESRGVSPAEIVQTLYEDSEAAREVHGTGALAGGLAQPASSDPVDDVTLKWLGCAAPGFFTYSFAYTGPWGFRVYHGHNALFVENCAAVHAPGQDKYITRITNTAKFASHPSYPAHVRRVIGASTTGHARAASFGLNRLGLPYNNSFAVNRTVWASSYNCSQLVWAAWMYASNVDLDRNGGLGVYPEDLWKSTKKTVLNRYLTS